MDTPSNAHKPQTVLAKTTTLNTKKAAPSLAKRCQERELADKRAQIKTLSTGVAEQDLQLPRV